MQTGSDLVPIYPAIPWGSFTPVFSDMNVRPATAEAARIPHFRRVWAVFQWNGSPKGSRTPVHLGGP
jgi:hypothetical protein